MVTFTKEIYINFLIYSLYMHVSYLYVYLISLSTHIYMCRHIYDDKGGIFMGRYDVLLVCEQVVRKPLSDKILQY